ncbi:MAG: glutamate/gamma-aminobutyrate family transporter YjeM [Levilactobacillus sp.]|jgi:amino acid transporter|uniref:glutamate/gamma-aminobutyrate family transporter YjeM n=1 Tax=Levilactobacillus sp. TaxID=2767919 RepID=UPI00258813CD|nr:glutamate/gamma-aminobutyrate family transporter YjeM [Levilactobacillus sp.]MCH4123415.1 glutamate/gamma-aminobutyrate family transporter YjeM [Levilactobacillus sp.]MCI1552447.1 glutamate/gamma-aminobutyrate family transporter YjeM [Levilactobacillus sp.]MCI1599034.1 glutamate/gamma-aminobutyrate family transporter YjeM [Levilactobacillus sp.]MCI1606050.1 glutamate/gamma-aminobutyrate family transporter YjeM [Levilactobacillus sp.]
MNKQKKIGLFSLILMIFTAIYGFANTTVAYDQMGYASIIWYVLAALLFFLPSALMLAEYGSSFKEAKGGIYSWLAGSIGEKWAFIGTFIWLSSWIIWMLSTSTKVWIPLSTLISGSDQTQTWSFLGLSSTQTVGLLGIFWILAVTFFATRGVNSIAKISSLGGIFVMVLTGVFFVASIVIVILNHGQLAEPINGIHSLIASPNPQFSSPMALLSFVTYAVFAYAGMESMGGITDSMDKPEKTFPKGLIISTIAITIMYSLSIFLWGISTNWSQVLGKSQVNLGNITYVLMNNLGLVLGKAMGLSGAASITIGHVLARLTGLSMFMAYLGSFFVLVYSPLKSFIVGSSPKLWPAKMTRLNKAGMPGFAMWIQAIVVAVFIFLVAFGGSAANQFYLILTDMGNVSTSFPYLFLIGAFPFFKRRTDLERPFVIFKSHLWTNVIVTVVLVILVGGIGFTCLQPILDHDYMTAFWTIIGPIFFGAVAWIFYHNAQKRSAKEETPANEN